MRRIYEKSFNPWVVVFIGTAIFHFTRGSTIDAVIFTLASALLLAQVFGYTQYGLRERPQVSSFWITAVVIVAAWVLYFSPRHGLSNVLMLLFFVPVGLALVYYIDVDVPAQLPPPIRRARLVWGLWALGFTLVELLAFVYSYLHPRATDLPTLSAVLDPILDQPLGRAIFVAIWLAFGVFMFGVRRR